MAETPRKAAPHVSQNEGLIFEKSSPGKYAYSLPPLDVPAAEAGELLGAAQVRKEIAGFPEVSEIEIIRHFTRLSTWNYGVDTGMYPLGSCTMKYNPRVNEVVAALPGLASEHPYQPLELSQGCLRILRLLERCLIEITGMDAITLQPAAGAHGELTGILMVRAYLTAQGNPRKMVLVPDSAHGTNPATAAIAGYGVRSIPSNSNGQLDLNALRQAMNEEVAALMITNPNTLGIFEKQIQEIAEVVHSRGGLIYLDGANMNALAGVTRPGEFGADVVHLNLHKTFSTPHGGGGPGAGPVCCSQTLAPFLAAPVVTRNGGDAVPEYRLVQPERSIGKISGFHGNFGVLVRAYTYIRTLGESGLKSISSNAVLNANYLMEALRDIYLLPYDRRCMHEVVFSAEWQKERGVSGLEVAKRLLDYGYHAPTMYFPLIVHEALMIEPTESETRETLDAFIQALRDINRESQENPDLVRQAPHTTPVSRLDEAAAARRPNLRWTKGE